MSTRTGTASVLRPYRTKEERRPQYIHIETAALYKCVRFDLRAKRYSALYLAHQKGLIVDQLIFSIPAVQGTDFLADLLSGMFSCKLSHGLEMNLLSSGAHVQ